MKFRERLAHFGFQTYGDYSKSQRWYDFRNRWFACQTTDKKCQVCGSPNIQLHHWTYERVCEEELGDVMGLCRRHHVKVHEWLKERSLSVKSTHDAIKGIKSGDVTNPYVKTKKAKKKKNPQLKKKKYKSNFCTFEGCRQMAKQNQTLCKSHRPIPKNIPKQHKDALLKKRRNVNKMIERARAKKTQPKPLEGKALSKKMAKARDVEAIKEFDRQRAKEVAAQRKALGL